MGDILNVAVTKSFFPSMDEARLRRWSAIFGGNMGKYSCHGLYFGVSNGKGGMTTESEQYVSSTLSCINDMYVSSRANRGIGS